MDRYKRYTPYNCSCGGTRRASMPQRRDMTETCLCDDQGISLAMAYVKKQEFRELHTPCEALSKGTLFTELYKPYGMGGCRR